MAVEGWRRQLLAGCDEDQIEAICTPSAPLLVIAAAGSGKTRVLTRRIAWRVLDGSAAPGHILALTFTRKAAAELRARLGELGVPANVTAGTFHAVALAQLRHRYAELGRTPPSLLDAEAKLLAQLGEDSRRRARAGRRLEDRALLAALASEIEWAKARLVSPDHYAIAASEAQRQLPLAPEEVAETYRRYEQEKRRRHLVDFEDLLSLLDQEMRRDPDFAAAQRWKFAHFFIDELQDANAAQLNLLDAWLGGRSDLFAVGDPRQAIYGWNGADPDAVIHFPARFAGGAVRALQTNYRSTPEVVALASAVLNHQGRDLRHPPRPERGAMKRAPETRGHRAGASLAAPHGAVPELLMRSGRPEGPVPTVTAYPDGDAEAEGIARALRLARRPGRAWSSCAVLCRTNAQLLDIEHALVAAAIPLRRAAGLGFLASASVREALTGLSRVGSAAGLRAELERLADVAESLAVPSDEQRVDGTDAQRHELEALIRLAEEYLELDPVPNGAGLRAYLRDAMRGEPSPSARDGVELTTFHRAKGLEWAVVFVAGIEDGFVPIAHATTPKALEEERRLLYVALSRAGEELHCSYATRRRFADKVVARQPSPYLAALEEVRTELLSGRSTDPRLARASLAASRALLGAHSPRRSAT